VSARAPGSSLPLRGVLFDLDDTLVDRRAAHRRAVASLLRERLGSASPAALEAVGTADADGLRPRSEFCAEVCRALPELGWSPDALWERYAPAVAAAVEPVPGRRAALEVLAAQLPLGVVTNGGPLQREKLDRADLGGLWATVRVSAEEGVAKPDPRLFARALDDLGLAPGEVLFVGDRREEDVAGARAAGLRACWIRGPRAGVAPEAEWVAPDVDAVLAALTQPQGTS